MTFGYNADCKQSRPILFIAHSFGGLVLKEALVRASIGEEYKNIRDATCGVIFLGTPHQGSSVSTLGALAARLTRLFGSDTTQLVYLQMHSRELANLQARFRKGITEGTKMFSFYETFPTCFWGFSFGFVVNSDSASRVGEGIPVDKDHSGMNKCVDKDDPPYKDICRAIRKILDNTRSPSYGKGKQEEQQAPVFMVPYTGNPDFVGREEILEKLKKHLAPSYQHPRGTSQAKIAIHGLGGVGKTQIAIAYAYWLHKEHPEVSVFWVHASDSVRFHQALSQIASECNVPGREDGGDVSKLVKDWLEKKDRRPWLMIIDNADDGEIFFGHNREGSQSSAAIHWNANAAYLGSYIPECSHGSVLVTTRNKQVGVDLTRSLGVIEVEMMNQAEAISLVRTRLGDDHQDNELMADLVNELDKIPLALTQAAAFMQKNSLSIQEYLEILKTSDNARVDLLSQPFQSLGRDTEVSHAVTATWMVSFKQIRDQHPHASNLLSLMAFLNRQEIPKALLSDHEESPLDTEKALGILKAFSLITAGKGTQSFDMHRLVQLVVRKWLLIEDESQRWAETALLIVSRLYPDAGVYENWKTCAAYLPHAYAVLGLTGFSEEVEVARADILHRTAYYLSEQGQLRQAEELYAQAVKKRKDVLGAEHPDTLGSMNNLASTYLGQGRLTGAEELNMQVVEARKRVLGAKHPETLLSMSNLASTYLEQGRLKEAEELKVQVVEASKSVLGAKHPDTLASMNNLALTYSKQGRLQEAEELGVQVVEASMSVLGAEHPGTLTSMSNLAFTYRDQGRLEEAIVLLSDVVERSKVPLGLDHPDTQERQAWLADWQCESSDESSEESS
ncbi:hypothetical protein H2201_007051 [Coniosporium apollinis]|uniref:DUF7779 domain-containing protein n=1 Tax=Coniosporium apollinis TaxID=61459 RepID=A0ABQ9NQF1_9PEZI|nr:hypothetical protein H2201_007051 [Coniosporium apollinis]